jgi:hypothetical protein
VTSQTSYFMFQVYSPWRRRRLDICTSIIEITTKPVLDIQSCTSSNTRQWFFATRMALI